ncbi:TOX high mobility group box family member 3 isoform X3 [Bombyx mori]|uniref:HMG box domain-containing protein n=1 Tax=Bombyx mori TaxID=7091 RepID=A0A8R2QUA9_BOMMO|nr:TOX high mobility group box family member 3 isoform X3 [Bombyx mori]
MRPENLEVPLSATRDAKNSVYAMNDQTFHTPSFGDEEFDIPLIHGQHAPGSGVQNTHIQYTQLHHAAPQVGMMNPAQDGLAPPGGAPSYQQPLYLQEPHTPVTTHSGAGAPAGNYMIQQQPGGQQRLLIMQPAQAISGPPTPSTPTQPSGPVYGSPQRASPPGTTSDDSDDSVPSQHSQLPGDAESLLPIHYCSASRQQQTTLHQIGVANMAVKRTSPDPMDNGMNRGQMQKKPKVQKKKKKRDPNEPQKPVSAYALFFRDTQAAIKGQNPNASFGEVSKIVASMWDGLDSEHKSVYKQKTEIAKKEYLKALAAYRASLVSKGGEQENQAMYNHTNNGNVCGTNSGTTYSNYYQGQTYGNNHSPQNYVQNASPQRYSPQNYSPGQPQPSYPGPAQQYPPNSQQSPQNYQANMTIAPQTYQNVPAQSPQGYQINSSTSNQNCQPNVAQSPRNYQPTQSPTNYPASSSMSPPGYRQVQATSPPMGTVHPAMQYHPQQQIQATHAQMQQAQVHQVQQYQQQQQTQQQQQQQQQQMLKQQQSQQQQILQQSQQQQLLHQQNQQQMLQQQSQQTQNSQQQQQAQPPQVQQQMQPIKSEQNAPNTSGNGHPQQSTEQNEKRSNSCIRQGCTNPAISNSEWEDEYCSNECVVSHCRDVFSSWVASNNSNQMQNFSAVK